MESFGFSSTFLLLECAILLWSGDRIQAMAFGAERPGAGANRREPGWLRLGERLHLALSAAVFLGTGLTLFLGLTGLLRRRNLLALSLAVAIALTLLHRRRGEESLARALGRGQPRLTVLGLAGLLGLMTALLGPGYPMVLGDRDPGVYVNTAVAAYRTHGFFERDLWADQLPVGVYEQSFGVEYRNRADLEKQAFHGTYRRRSADGATTLVPEFPLLYPSALALSGMLFGFDGLLYLGPFLTALALLALALLLRHYVWTGAALAGALLFGTSYATLFFARFPMPETLCQSALIAAVLHLHRAAVEKRRGLEVWAGVAAGLVPLARIDGLVLSAATLAVHAGLASLGQGGRLRWFGLSFYPLSALALGLLRTVHWSYLERSMQGMLGAGRASKLLAVFDLGLTAALLLAGAWFAGSLVRRLGPRGRERLGTLVLLAVAVLALGARYLRPSLVGTPRSASAVMLEWYLYPGVFVVASLGLVLAWRRARKHGMPGWILAWVLVLAAFHLGDPFVESDHPWWARRVFWHLVPAASFLTAVALGSGSRRLAAVAGAAGVAALALAQLRWSGPLLGYRPFAALPRDVGSLIAATPEDAWLLVDDARWALPLSRIGGRRVACLRHGTPELAQELVRMLRSGRQVLLVCDNPQAHAGWLVPPLAVGTVGDFHFSGWPGHAKPSKQLPRLPFEPQVEQHVAIHRLFLLEAGPGGELPAEAFESEKAVLVELAGRNLWQMPSAGQGFVLYGPRATLAPGRYRAVVRVESLTERLPLGWADVAADYGSRQVVARRLEWDAATGIARVELPFDLGDVGRAVEVRVFLDEAGQVRVGAVELHADEGTR